MATFEQASLAMQHHEDMLFENPNVAYTSVVERNNDGDMPGDYVVEVGLVEEEPVVDDEVVSAESAFAESIHTSLVPKALSIPFEGGGVGIQDSPGTVDVVTDVSGEVSAESFVDRRRPARGGNSCGNPRRRSAGTLGIAFRSGRGIFILSNWHVLYGAGGRDGDPVVQQGVLDGGRVPYDVIARNQRGWLDTYRDAAIAQVTGPNLVAAGTRCYGAVRGLARAAIGRAVKKCGRTTMATTGVVRSTAATIRVAGYPGGPRLFRDQIQLSRMSAAGDSGSVVIDTVSNDIVGLLFAGGRTATFANKIERIFRVAGADASLALDIPELADVSFDDI